MPQENRELQGMQYRFRKWLQENGGFAAQTGGVDRAWTIVQPETVIDACVIDHPEWERDFVVAEVRKAKESYPGVRVFEQSPLTKRAGREKGFEQ